MEVKKLTQVITEAPKKEKSIVIGVGRFNPPTTGHEVLVNKVMTEAQKISAEFCIYASYSQDPKKNPLDVKTKLDLLKKFFPKMKFQAMPKPFPNKDGKTVAGPYAIAQKLSDAGYTRVYIVTGADHMAEYNKIKQYIDTDPKSTEGYKFSDFKVINAGARDPDAEGVQGMSASKMRKAVFDGDFDAFREGVPAHVKDADAKKMFMAVKKGMQLKEEWLWEEKASDVTILCLTSAEGSTDGSSIEKMEKSCKKKGIAFHVIKMKYAHINSMEASGEKITIEMNEGEDKPKKLTIKPQNTLCFVRGGVMNSELGVGLATVLQNNGVFMVNEKGAMEICANKLQTALALQKYNLPHPRTAFVSNEESVETAMKAIGDKYPVVVKTVTGAEGIGVSIIESEKSLRSVLQSLWKFGAEVILQEFLPGFKNDVRSIVLNGKIFACAKRDKAKGDFRTNIARGSSGGAFKLSPEEIELVEKVALVSKCYYVGVDHVVVNGKPYVIEMNASPGSGNMYTLYENGKPTEEVDGQGLIDALIEHVSNKSNWKLFASVAVTENIMVDGVEYTAKIDTGNSGYNSIDANDIKINEKNHTVSFKLNGKSLKKNIVSRIKIRRGGTEEREIRPIVLMDVEFAGREYKNVKFSLANREHMDYKVLIGLRFLRQTGMQVNPKEMVASTPKTQKEELNMNEGAAQASPKDKETGLPKKYVSGLSRADAKARVQQFAARKARSDSDPKAWEKLPGDPKKTARRSKYSIAFAKKFGTKSEAVEIQEILEQAVVLDNQQSISSRIEKARELQSGVLTVEEKDAWDVYIQEQKKMMYAEHAPKSPATLDEEFEWILYEHTDEISFSRKIFKEVLEVGTNKIRKTYAKDTPGQNDIAEEMDDEEKNSIYKEWSKLVNMGAKELQNFIDSEDGKEAGLSRKEAGKAGTGGGKITSGRDSARAIVRMLGKKKDDWQAGDWKWANKQISFISRMKGAKGPLRDDKGRPTRKLLALKIWGHNPEK
jgi:RimK family alpha-L-glutamate ligase